MRIGEWLNQFFHGAGATEHRHRASETAKEAAKKEGVHPPKEPTHKDTIGPAKRAEEESTR